MFVRPCGKIAAVIDWNVKSESELWPEEVKTGLPKK